MSSKHAQSKIRDKSSTYITDKFAINYMLGCYYMSRYLYKRLLYLCNYEIISSMTQLLIDREDTITIWQFTNFIG